MEGGAFSSTVLKCPQQLGLSRTGHPGVAVGKARRRGLVGALPSGIASTAVAPSEGSDFVARLATLDLLPEQDPGVPETMAAQAADELPQVHRKARSRSALQAWPQCLAADRTPIRQTMESGAGLRR